MSLGLSVPAEYRLIHLRCVGSTNDEAVRMAGLGAPPGLVVWADEQWGGRGRLGRHWVSPPGNLHLSLLLPLDRALAQLAQLSFVAALALWDAIHAAMPEAADPMLKWPNDVLLAGGKTAGILLETYAPPGECVEAVILGMGVNLRHAPPEAPYPVTSLAAHGGDIEPGQFIELLLTALSHWRRAWRRGGFADIRSHWLARAHPLGFPLQAQTATTALKGEFAGLDDDGALLLRGAKGIARLMAGDLSLAGGGNAVSH